MNFLARAKSSASKRFFHSRSINVLQQLNFYGTRATEFHHKTVHSTSTNPKSQKSFKSSSFSQRIDLQTAELTDRSKPGEIPFQSKVANFVNLIGYVKSPIIRFQSASNGKHFSAIVISPEYSCRGRDSLLIPVVFEGDLADMVGNYVKENDYVFVSGQLSVDYLGILLSENVGKLHIVGENLNFVQRVDKTVSDNTIRVSDHNDNSRFGSSMEDFLLKNSKVVSHPTSNIANRQDSDVSPLQCDTEKVEEKSDKMKKDVDDLWRDLLHDPLQWWDYRDHKSKGSVNEKFPDFKHKENGKSLWVGSAPKWVLHGIAKLEFDVKFIKPKQAEVIEPSQNSKNNGSSWKNLVENPEKWWDNRVRKLSPKAPDFKHKETGEGLWLSRSPDWALSRLPPLREGTKSSSTL